MCGIVGYVGPKPPVPLLMEGLKCLEYRGYDSAGVAVVAEGAIRRVRASGKLEELVRRLEEQPLEGRYGLGHTRWATHGRPLERNAHPIVDALGRVAVIHNGIIENFALLRSELQLAGWRFTTETDTEVVANLISLELETEPDLLAAVRRAAQRLTGHYAFGVVTTMCAEEEIVVVRQGPPLVLGLSDGEQFLASDPAALVRQTKNILFLENGDTARLRRSGVEIWDSTCSRVRRNVRPLEWNSTQTEKGRYRHYMLKEIHEQPRVIQETFDDAVDVTGNRVVLPELASLDTRLAAIRQIQIVACGTSWHAALIGKFLIEGVARIPVEVDYGSEYRYRDPIVDDGVLVVGVSQSGETADTLSAMEAAQQRGALLACICNVPGSQATRISEATLLTHAGPEIGVASTKAFTTQLTVFYLLALYLAQLRGRQVHSDCLRQLAMLPQAMAEVLEIEPRVRDLSRRYSGSKGFLYLGRGSNYPIALEGALKLKEISYIHAEGYPAGELKHGPIALVDRDLPVVAVATGNRVFDKIAGNLQEVKAREGKVLAITDRSPEELKHCADEILRVPSVGDLLQPIVNVVPLQLLAYHIALRGGADVDQPRNLAKSVTVE